MPKDFTERYGPWALITGASSGLGAEFARQLAGRGLNVVLVARRRERLEALARQLRETDAIDTRVIAADLTAAGACDEVAGQVADLEVGLLINNAGFGLLGRHDELDPRGLEQMTVLNCVVPVLLTNRLLPPMLERRRGGLIFLASLAAYQPCPYFTVYGATKAFNLFIGEGLHAEYRRLGIDSLAVSPGVTQTEFLATAGMPDDGSPRLATAEAVVADALKHLGHRASFIHGTINNCVAFLNRVLPRRVVLAVTDQVFQRRRREQGR